MNIDQKLHQLLKDYIPEERDRIHVCGIIKELVEKEYEERPKALFGVECNCNCHKNGSHNIGRNCECSCDFQHYLDKIRYE